MGAITRLTERVEALEAEVAELREQVAAKAPAKATRPAGAGKGRAKD
jgi:cell division septum initiation protein DivIVA